MTTGKYKTAQSAKVTTKSLAKEMGISHTTISNAWNNPEKLSVELRERILRYAREVGFQGPDQLARALLAGDIRDGDEVLVDWLDDVAGADGESGPTGIRIATGYSFCSMLQSSMARYSSLFVGAR